MTRLVRFGRFEFDLDTMDLRREGRPVPLQPQPAKVLGILLRQPGELVTREVIQDEIWPDEPSRITRDQGLNACIRGIRDALGGRADAPIYIQTHPRRGYRFIAPVERVHETAVSADGTSVASSGDVDDAGAGGTSDRRDSGSRRTGRLVAAGLAVVALAGVLFGRAISWGESAAADRPVARLAVLPFDNLTRDPELDVLSDGIAQELSTRLAGIDPERLAVIAYASTAFAHREATSLGRLASDLDADYLLAGHLSKDEDGLTVSVQLIRAADLAYAWTGSLEREFVGFREIADALAARLAGSLALEPGAGTGNWAWPVSDEPDEEVRSAYVTAVLLLERQTPEGAVRSVPYLERVVRADPEFALGRARLARALFWSGDRDGAEREARAALELNPSVAEAHELLASIALDRDFDWEGARAGYERAIELAPGRHEFVHAYAHYLVSAGATRAARDALSRALELNPLAPVLVSDVGWVEYWAGDYERAAERCVRAAEILAPEIRARAHRCALHAFARLGRWDDARERALHIMEDGDAGPDLLSTVGKAEAREGLRAYYRWAVRPENRELALGSSSAYARARGLADLNDVEGALAALEEALETRPRGLTTLAVEPRFDALRDHPRFQTILDRISVPEAARDDRLGSSYRPRELTEASRSSPRSGSK